MSAPERIAAYEEIWRREESELWDWLEERIEMQGSAYPVASEAQDTTALKKARKAREKALRGQGMKGKLADERMSEREVDHAIKVTEEKLADLKISVLKRREGKEDE